MSTLIHTEDLSKSFRRTAALVNVNLDVDEGTIYALIGPNGTGKTTLIKTLLNLLRPTAGRSEVLGTDSRRLSPVELQRIGYVSENQKLPGWMTLDYLLNYLRPFYPAWDDALAADLVRQFELPPGRKLRHYSRGMQMKAALVSVLAYRPSVLVLDEPFSGLDPLVRQEFTEGLLGNVDNTSVLISSHDLADVERFASHIGYMEHGRLALSEEMTALSSRFREVEVTLDAPRSLPAPWPAEWMEPQSYAAVVKFVDSDFEERGTRAKAARLFPDARRLEFYPMPLRDIFIALAKTGRKAA